MPFQSDDMDPTTKRFLDEAAEYLRRHVEDLTAAKDCIAGAFRHAVGQLGVDVHEFAASASSYLHTAMDGDLQASGVASALVIDAQRRWMER